MLWVQPIAPSRPRKSRQTVIIIVVGAQAHPVFPVPPPSGASPITWISPRT